MGVLPYQRRDIKGTDDQADGGNGDHAGCTITDVAPPARLQRRCPSPRAGPVEAVNGYSRPGCRAGFFEKRLAIGSGKGKTRVAELISVLM